MLDFPEKFYQTEIREGFQVDSTMKCFWAAEMEVLREIAEICERHKLTWYTAYGTLLGAVRHQGYIPWDDDMDIWMLREDYMKFLDAASKELPDEYIIHSPLTERGYLQFHSCVLNAKSVSVAPERLKKFHNCPFVVGVDIFPLDYLPQNAEEEKEERELLDRISVAATILNKEKRNSENLYKVKCILDSLQKKCHFKVESEWMKPEKKEKLISSLYRLGNELVIEYQKKPGNKLVMYMDYLNWPTKIYEEEWFSVVDYMPFEGFGVPVPAKYDQILRVIYGDYQVRIKNTSMHGYPMYKKQLEQMREILKSLEENSKMP